MNDSAPNRFSNLLITQRTQRTRRAVKTSFVCVLCAVFSGNKRLNALHRFAGRCGCPSRPEWYRDDTRTEYPRHMTWISRSRDVRVESPLRPYLALTGDPHTLQKLQLGLPFAASAAIAMRSPKRFKNRTGSGRSFTMKVERASAASNRMYLPLLDSAMKIRVIYL